MTLVLKKTYSNGIPYSNSCEVDLSGVIPENHLGVVLDTSDTW